MLNTTEVPLEYYTIKDNKHGYKTLTIYSGEGYSEADRKLLKIIDNGNGYLIKDYSWSCVIPDNYYNLDYSVAELLWDNLGLLIHGENSSE